MSGELRFLTGDDQHGAIEAEVGRGSRLLGALLLIAIAASVGLVLLGLSGTQRH